jgi:hypothetical protein
MVDVTAGRLLYVITGDDSGLKSKLKQSETQAKTAGDKIGKGLGGIKGGWIAAAAAVVGYVVAVKDVLNAYVRQEAADLKLRSALKATGDATKETFNDFKDFAAELQKITTVGDEATQEIIALGLRMGISKDQIKDATKGAIGLSQSLGIDLQSALKIVAQGMEGQYTMLGRYVPALRTATTEAEKAAIFQKTLNDGFKEATEITQTYGGSVAQMKNAIGDAKEVFGEFIANGLLPIVKAITHVAVFLQGLPAGIKAASIALTTGAVAVKALAVAFGVLNIASGGLPLILGGILTAVVGIGLAIKNQKEETQNLSDLNTELLRQTAVENKRLWQSLERQYDEAVAKRDKKTAQALHKEIEALKKQSAEIREELGKRSAFRAAQDKKETDAAAEATAEANKKKIAAFIEAYKAEAEAIKQRNDVLDEAEKTRGEVLALTLKTYDQAVKDFGFASDAAKVLAEVYKKLKAEMGDDPADPTEMLSKMDASLTAVRVAFAGMTGEMAAAMNALVGSITEVMQGLETLRNEGTITASDWVTLIIQAVQAYVTVLSQLTETISGAAFDKGYEKAGRFFKLWSDYAKSLLDIRSAIIPIFGTIWALAEKGNKEFKKSIEETTEAVKTAMDGIEQYAVSLRATLLNQAIDAWEKYAREVININTGLNEYLDKQREYQLAREERMREDELGILQDVLGSSLDEREKYLAQLRIDEIENEKLLEAARIEAARQQEELDKKLALARLAIKAAEFESSIQVRMATLKADEAEAMAGTSTITRPSRRNAAQMMIKMAYEQARNALGRAGTVGVAGLELERGLITGEVSPDTIGAGTFVDQQAKRMERPIVITLDGKQIASTVQDYNLNNLLPAKAN